jgi:hypothetical protein
MKDTLSILIVGTGTNRGVHKLRFPKTATFIVSIILLFSFCFSALILFDASQYVIHQIQFIRQDITSLQLENEMMFIQKISGEMEKEMAEIFNLDDNLRLMYGMTSIHKDSRNVGIGGPEAESLDPPYLLEPRYAQLRDIKTRLQVLSRQAEFEISSIEETQKEIRITSKKLRRFPSVLPVFGQITSGFGSRFHPIERMIMSHEGIDIANERWTPVYASADGVVRLCEFTQGYGNLIVIDHGYGYRTLYGHLQDYTVKPNQFVIRGDLIGYVGNSGRTTGPHLHYEIRKDDVAKDPLDFIYPISTVIN